MVKKKKTLSEFIDDGNRVHGGRYTYERSVYVDAFTPLLVTCPIHGDFSVSPNAHTSKNQGCPTCAREGARIKASLGKELFVNKATEVHGDKYDYSNVKYNNNYTKVAIVCPTHGEFKQTPHSHLKGSGCPLCKESKLERKVRLFLDRNGMCYSRQYRDGSLGAQTLDFYLKEFNVGIECQGTQHIRGKWFRDEGKPSHDDNIIESDIKKNEKCKANGIRLLYYVGRNCEMERMLSDERFKRIYDSSNTFCSLDEMLSEIKRGQS